MITRSQQHAQAIAGQVGEVQHMSRKIQKQYGSLCHRFPIMVLRNGLAQAVGFLAAKSKNSTPHGLLLSHLAAHLSSNANAASYQTDVNKADIAKYRRMTREALAAAVWYKRFAESLLNVDPSDSCEVEDDSENLEANGVAQ
ncbi:MAG: type III-B CRISPR module-associated protein Cmr5 [Proteobacteria bacterium]|nr:type III-B CRISPR module-associated protein Cmr5 [Pseudomonadota bacterium]